MRRRSPEKKHKGTERAPARDGRAKVLLTIAREQTACRCNLFTLVSAQPCSHFQSAGFVSLSWKCPSHVPVSGCIGHRDAVSHSLGAKVTANSYGSYHCLRLIMSAYVRIHVHRLYVGVVKCHNHQQCPGPGTGYRLLSTRASAVGH